MGRLYRKPAEELERSKSRTQESTNRLEYLRQQSLAEQRRPTTTGQCYFVPVNGKSCQVCLFPNGQYNTVCN